jgi:beta-ribofuranosylaminobenzene 5'-phosphate synthase
MTVIRAYPRIHIALIDLGNATSRRYGGCGFTLDWPPVEVSVSDGEAQLIAPGLEARARCEIDVALHGLREAYKLREAKTAVLRLPPQHVGFGTKTALVLSVLQSHSLHHRQSVPIEELQRLSGRGGASGVGIHSFFTGGLIVDAGQPATVDRDFRPSSFAKLHAIPPLVARHAIPLKWNVGLFLTAGRHWSGSSENDFFKQNTPLEARDVYLTMGAVFHGVLPAFATGDIKLLQKSLLEIHATGFKTRELNSQSSSVKSLYHALATCNKWAVGLSSMGPLVYVVAEGEREELEQQMNVMATATGTHFYGMARGRNEGFDAL